MTVKVAENKKDDYTKFTLKRYSYYNAFYSEVADY